MAEAGRQLTGVPVSGRLYDGPTAQPATVRPRSPRARTGRISTFALGGRSRSGTGHGGGCADATAEEPALTHRFDQVEEHRDEEDPHRGCEQHPEEHPGA